MSEIPYITNIIRVAKENIANQKLNRAYSEILAGLKSFPYNKALKKLRIKCEKQIQRQIDNKVKSEINHISDFMKHENYQKALLEIERVFKFAPNNQKLLKFYRKAKEKVIEKSIKANKELLIKKRKELENEFSKGNEEQTLKTLFDIEQNHGTEPAINDLISEYRDKIIESRIKTKHDLLLTTKFTAIRNFIDSLETIDQDNIRVKKLKQVQHSREFGEQISEKSEFVYESIVNIKTLIRLKKYNEALIAINEIIELTPNYTKAKRLKQKIETKLYKITKKIVIKQIKLNKQDLKQDFKNKRKDYIRI